MSPIVPFRIAVPITKLDILKQKIALTTFPEDSPDTEQPWSRGVPGSEIKRLTAYWQHNFSWPKVEAEINEALPQFTTNIEVKSFGTYNIHFVHKSSSAKNAIPLLFLHGWPGSFLEVSKVIDELTEGGYGAKFDVVAPSLVDFGFSDPSGKAGFNVDQHAEVYHKLMLALGYEEYVVQGGDIGSLVARFIAKKYGKKHCKAIHLNSAVPTEPTATSHPELYAKIQATPLTSSELAGLANTANFSKEGMGYYKLLTTKPQTISYALNDSPIGLLAWIYQQLHDCSDSYPWTDDEILTRVSIYWFSKAGPSASGNLYYEMEHRDPTTFEAASEHIDVPLGIARFPKDSILLPKLWNQTLGPVVWESESEKGGHFGAWEDPDAIVRDLRGMFEWCGPLFGCVEGRNGYRI